MNGGRNWLLSHYEEKNNRNGKKRSSRAHGSSRFARGRVSAQFFRDEGDGTIFVPRTARRAVSSHNPRLPTYSKGKLILKYLHMPLLAITREVLARNKILGSIGQTTVSKFLEQFVRAVNSKLKPKWITFPNTEAGRQQVAGNFSEKFRLPNILGCIDCTHVKLFPPPTPGQIQYKNRHGFTSINVQLIADAECRILNVNANYPGRVHDQFIFNNSVIKTELRRLHTARIGDYHLLGDSGYALEPWLMTPILDARAGTPEDKYTKWHCQTRNVVERTNGYLKGAFRSLGIDRSLHYYPEKASALIYASCTLYNIMKHYRVPMELLPDLEAERRVDPHDPHNSLSLARGKRQRIVRDYFSN